MDTTVAALIERYLAHAQAVNLFGAETLAERKRTLGAFVLAFGTQALTECRAFQLADWIESNPRWRSTSTRKAKSNQVNAVFNWGVQGGRIASNPFRSVRYEEAEPRPPLPDPAYGMIVLVCNKPFERVVRFLRLTGCRLSELCGMLWEDVDFERGIVVLQRHKTRKKTQKPRLIVLVPDAIALLRVLETQHGRVGHVFRNNRGKPWNRRTLGQQLRRMKARGEVQTEATLHGLRHQVGTQAVLGGAPLKMVAEMLGHASVTTTERYYVHVSGHIEEIRAAAEAGKPK